MTGTSYMAKEVSNQPALWMDTYQSILNKKDFITSFLTEIYKISDLQIILTGAGSSAFIGEILQSAFHKNTGILVKAIGYYRFSNASCRLFHKGNPYINGVICKIGR